MKSHGRLKEKEERHGAQCGADIEIIFTCEGSKAMGLHERSRADDIPETQDYISGLRACERLQLIPRINLSGVVRANVTCHPG